MRWCFIFSEKFHFTTWSSSSFSTFPSEFNNHQISSSTFKLWLPLIVNIIILFDVKVMWHIQDLCCTYTFGKVSFHHVEFILLLNTPLEILESSKYSPLFSNFCYFTSNHQYWYLTWWISVVTRSGHAPHVIYSGSKLMVLMSNGWNDNSWKPLCYFNDFETPDDILKKEINFRG